MKIVEKFPPNYQDIVNAFGDIERHKPVFAWGDTLYNPFKVTVTPDLEAHEEAHSKRQNNFPEVWWQKYLIDPKFRLEEEIVGYGEQMLYLKTIPEMPSKLLEWFKEKTAQALSSSLYGNLCTYGEAVSKIRNYTKNI